MGQIATWLPPTLFGANAVPGTLLLRRRPVTIESNIRNRITGKMISHKSTDMGWTCHAVKEKDLPVDRRSSTTISHFLAFIPHPFKIWFSPFKKKPFFAPFYIPWIFNGCVPWVLHSCSTAQPPLQQLRPMVRGPGEEQLLQQIVAEFTRDPSGSCPRVVRQMTIKKAESLLEVKWNVSVDRLYAALRRKQMLYDFREYPEEEEPEVTEKFALMEEAFTRLMAARFMSAKHFKPVESNRNRLMHHQQDNLLLMVGFLLRDKAVSLIRREQTAAPERGEDPPPQTPQEVELVAKEMLVQIFRARGENERADLLVQEISRERRRERGLGHFIGVALASYGIGSLYQ